MIVNVVTDTMTGVAHIAGITTRNTTIQWLDRIDTTYFQHYLGLNESKEEILDEEDRLFPWTDLFYLILPNFRMTLFPLLGFLKNSSLTYSYLFMYSL